MSHKYQQEIKAQMLVAYQNASLCLYTNDPSKFPKTFGEWFDAGKNERARLKKVQTNEEFGAALLRWAKKNGLEEGPENGA